MKVRNRFIKSVIATAKANTAPLPWTRGETRKAFIAARNGKRTVLVKTA